MPEFAVFYEHPAWFAPLFAALDRRGVAWSPVPIQDHVFDPAGEHLPAPVILNRLAMSSFPRQVEHAIVYSQAVLAHWEGLGARVINGAGVLAYDGGYPVMVKAYVGGSGAGMVRYDAPEALEADVAAGLTPMASTACSSFRPMSRRAAAG